MFIKEVCRLCRLTKKAVEYYEGRGLITPRIQDNGYRVYGEAEVEKLKEISVLRKYGFSMQAIHTIVNSRDKGAALTRYKYINDLKIKRLAASQKCIDNLIRHYDIDEHFNNVQQSFDQGYTIKEKILFAFPGYYGIYLLLHFGRFLDVAIETDEQQQAYDEIISYLDHVQTQIPDELAKYLEENFRQWEDMGFEEFSTAMEEAVDKALQDPGAFVENENLQQYIDYRLSDEYKQSPAGQLASLMLDFQNNSGYQDLFIRNLKVISPAYQQYWEKIEAANEILLQKFPEAKLFYTTDEQ